MYVASQSNKTFSNHSLDNWQSKKCDFCMYRQVIFQQLDRLKEAVLIKNQRILQLEDFIKKISKMAFTNPPNINSINQAIDTSFRNNQLSEQLESITLQQFKKQKNGLYLERKFQDPGQISFRASRPNSSKFALKTKQHSSGLNHRFKKINELNEIKKEIQNRMHDSSVNKQNYRHGVSIDTFSNQYDTIQTQSEPQSEGQIGSIQHISGLNNNSVTVELSDRKSKFNKSTNYADKQGNTLVRVSSNKQNNSEQKSSIDIIKDYIRRLK